MKYMLLIYGREGQWEELTPEQREANMAEWFTYTRDIQEAGVMLAGDPLHGTSAATSVRVKDGETLVTDGPFAETKEALGGYYLVEVESLDDAIAWAARCPGAHYGTVEVRPLMDLTMPEAAG